MKTHVLTPREFQEQWVVAPNKFEVGVLNFEVAIGSAVRDIFRESFFLHRFNSAGAPAWTPRADNKPHPLLLETGTLKNSLTWRRISGSHKKGVLIYTNPAHFFKSKRQVVKGVNRNFCYAGIQNGAQGADKPGEYANYRGNVPPRQFMGHSTKVFEALDKYSKLIFEGLP